MNGLKIKSYIQALNYEKEKKYDQAIEYYLLATLEESDDLSTIYYRLGLILEKKKKFEASCDAFLLAYNYAFQAQKSNFEDLEKNKVDLYEYLLKNEVQSSSEWLEFAKKSETLKCWSVASYAYKELVLREEKFVPQYYVFLGLSLMQEQKYRDAAKYLKEQRQIQGVECAIETSKESYLVYEEYFNRFAVEEKIILYENFDEISTRPYELYLSIEQDAHFDAYRHVWIVEKEQGFTKELDFTNSIIIQRNSDLYKRFISKAKYFISNTQPDFYYKCKKNQIYVYTEEEKAPKFTTHKMYAQTTNYEIIQEVFFGNGKVASTIVKRDDSLMKLYQVAIDEFDNKQYSSAHQKFLEIKRRENDLKYVLPTTYYLAESQFQIDIKSKQVEELLIDVQYCLDAGNFMGVDYLLLNAIETSVSQSYQWKSIRISFLEILEDVKRNNTKNIRAIKDKKFLEKIENFSIFFNESLEASLLPYQIWFLFSHLFIFARLYTKYELLRSKALEFILNMVDVPYNYKINALAETNHKNDYVLLKEQLLKENGNKPIQKNLEYLGASELYFNRHDLAIAFYKKLYSKEELAFSEYIKDKTIAIVGPQQSELNLGEEIDSHDVVVRFNYRGLDSALKKSHGVKTDVSFYIMEILIENRINVEDITHINELDWAIFDTGHKKDSICFTGVTSNLRSRYYNAHEYANPYFKGTANGIQRVLLDLLRFDVGSIKIYNTNLFLENLYNKNYKSRGSLGPDYFNFIWHDPLSNFIFLKRLKEHKIVDADGTLSNILKLSPSEYIHALEKQYGRNNLGT